MGTGTERVALDACSCWMAKPWIEAGWRLMTPQAERRSINHALKPLVSSSLMQSRILPRWLRLMLPSRLLSAVPIPAEIRR